MRISLIYPLLSKERSRIDQNKQYWPPLGLAYIAAYLEKDGHDVNIIDRDLILRKNKLDFDFTDKETIKSLTDFKSDIVGIGLTTPNVSDAKNVLSLIKNSDPQILTVIGGPHCTSEPLLTMEICKDADVLVKGEGEMTLSELASKMNFKDIDGIVYRDRDRIIENQSKPLISDIDDLPLPARHLLDMEFYLRPSRFISRNLNLRTTTIFTARGCPYKCHYCAGPLVGGGKVRFHSPEKVIFEISELIKNYKIEAVFFAEDMFLANKKRAIRIFDLMKENNIHKKIVWMAQISTNVVDEDYLRLMKSAGCVHVDFGFESGSQRMLELMNKKSDVNKNLEAAKTARKVGIGFEGYFIAGFPGERVEDFEATIEFIKKVKPSHTSLNIFMPLPGTFICKKLKSENKEMIPWDSFGDPDAPQINYADMSEDTFKYLYDRARLKVILPLNLYFYIKDNLKNPVRLLYGISTQFRGVLIKAVRSYIRLRNIKK